MIYLDNAATTLIKPSAVHAAVRRAMETMASPGRGAYKAAMRASELALDCRIEAAELFHVPEPEQVVFTMNATHALNIAISSLAGKGSRVLISGFEHNAVTRPLHALGAKIVTAGSRLFDREDTLRSFEERISSVDLVVCTHVSNVFGYILPICEIAELCRMNGVPLILDASQSAGVLEVDMRELGAAFIAMPGHKALYGPQGTGLLLCGMPGVPLLHGGSGSDSVRQAMPDYLPDRLEAGTHNIAGIAGLLEGLRFVRERGLQSIAGYEQKLLARMAESLRSCGDLELFRGDAGMQTGVLSVRCGRMSCESLAALLDERGICVRAGLHCAPLAHQSAGTIDGGTVRFSFSAFTDPAHIDAACLAIKELVGGVKEHDDKIHE